MTETLNHNPGSIEDLVAKLKAAGLRNERGLLKPAVYGLATELLPIECVDLVPVKMTPEGARIGVIERATGPEKGKLAVLGGGVTLDETIVEAIQRHLQESLGKQEFAFHEGNDDGRPFYVSQFAHVPSSAGLFDPSKHAIAQNYLIDINEPKVARDEALGFRWISGDEIPEVTAYNHGIIMAKAVEFLGRLHLVPQPQP